MTTKPKYPPKVVDLNFTEELPDRKKRKSRLLDINKIDKNVKARIVLDKLLSVHHKGKEQQAIHELGESGRNVLHKIIEEPNNFDYVVRRDAISALANYQDADSILLLASVVNDKNEDEVNIGRALDAIGHIGGYGAMRILEQAYQSRKRYIKNRALRAIVNCGSSCHIPIFKDALEKSKSSKLQLKAYEHLVAMGIDVKKPKIETPKGDLNSRVVRDK